MSKFIALQDVTLDYKVYKVGDEVPANLATVRLQDLGIVKAVAEAVKPAERVQDKVEIVTEKAEKTEKKSKKNKKAKVDEELLVENTSDISVETAE